MLYGEAVTVASSFPVLFDCCMGRRIGFFVGFIDTDSFFLRSNLTSVGVLVRRRSCYGCCYDSCSFFWTVLRANLYIVGEASCGD